MSYNIKFYGARSPSFTYVSLYVLNCPLHAWRSLTETPASRSISTRPNELKREIQAFHDGSVPPCQDGISTSDHCWRRDTIPPAVPDLWGIDRWHATSR